MYNRILYKLHWGSERGACCCVGRPLNAGLGCLFQDVRWLGSPRPVALRGREFGRLRFRFGGGFCGVGFERGKDDACLLPLQSSVLALPIAYPDLAEG